mmetsp:Transcript_67606/g.180733  ORF Transcript_67606/g.180733 Transcript_67606/m.180733 type:complete len:143 (+) Transcript_67606:304-732(+)
MLNQSYGYRIYIGDNCLPDPSTSTKTSSDMIKDTGTSKTISISVSGSSRFYLALFLREEMSGSLAGVSGPTSPCSFTIDMSNAEVSWNKNAYHGVFLTLHSSYKAAQWRVQVVQSAIFRKQLLVRCFDINCCCDEYISCCDE